MNINFARENVKAYLPGLYKLIIDNNSFGWWSIERIFNKIIKDRSSSANGQTIMVSATILDIIWHAKKSKSPSRLLLNYFNSLFDDLGSRLKPNEKLMIQ